MNESKTSAPVAATPTASFHIDNENLRTAIRRQESGTWDHIAPAVVSAVTEQVAEAAPGTRPQRPAPVTIPLDDDGQGIIGCALNDLLDPLVEMQGSWAWREDSVNVSAVREALRACEASLDLIEQFQTERKRAGFAALPTVTVDIEPSAASAMIRTARDIRESGSADEYPFEIGIADQAADTGTITGPPLQLLKFVEEESECYADSLSGSGALKDSGYGERLEEINSLYRLRERIIDATEQVK